MEIILCEDVEKLGKAGQVVSVKEGFARNFLLPRKKAYPATPANLKKIDQEKIKKALIEEKQKQQAEELATRLSKVSCTISVEVNDLDKLYGSVTEAEIVRALETEGYTIDKKDILLEKPIEDLGIYEVPVKLHPQVT